MTGTPEIDVLAVQQDAALINALAVRDGVDHLSDDLVAGLLGAWVASIDAGIDTSVAWTIPEQDLEPVPTGRRSGRGRAGVVAGITVMAFVVSGGAAAAVTGDPFAVVRAPIQALERVSPFGEDDDNAKTTLPEPAAPVAEPNKLLASAQRALAQGDVEEAARLLAEAQALLGDTLTPGQQQRIDRILEQLSGETKGRPDGKGKPDHAGQGKPDDAGQGKPDDAGQGKPDHAGQGKPDDAGQGKPDDAGQSKPQQGTDDSTSAQGSGEPGSEARTGAEPETADPGAGTPGSNAGGQGQAH